LLLLLLLLLLSDQQYFMNGSVLDVKGAEKDLSVWISSDLTWTIQVYHQSNTKYILMLLFRTEWSYQDRLIQCNLLPMSYWHEMMDLVFLYKATNVFIGIDRSILPTIHRSARVTRSCHTSNATTYTAKRCRTLTYQCSFFICASRIWNSLPTYIRDNSLSLASLKNKLFEYHTNALLYIYNPYNLKTWKLMCPKCNVARALVKDLSCCF